MRLFNPKTLKAQNHITSDLALSHTVDMLSARAPLLLLA